MADRNDRDILIEIETTVKAMVKQLDKLNARTAENESNVGCLQGCFKVVDVRIKNLERRPNAVKAVLGVGAFLGILLTVFEFWKG